MKAYCTSRDGCNLPYWGGVLPVGRNSAMGTIFTILFAILTTVCAADEQAAPARDIGAVLAKYEARLAAQDAKIAALEARIAALEKTSAPSKAQPVRTVVESRITSDFSGLELNNVFTLANGQIWRQTEPYIYIRIAVMPRVTIYPSESGVMKMQVEGITRPVTVELLK